MGQHEARRDQGEPGLVGEVRRRQVVAQRPVEVEDAGLPEPEHGAGEHRLAQGRALEHRRRGQGRAGRRVRHADGGGPDHLRPREQRHPDARHPGAERLRQPPGEPLLQRRAVHRASVAVGSIRSCALRPSSSRVRRSCPSRKAAGPARRGWSARGAAASARQARASATTTSAVEQAQDPRIGRPAAQVPVDGVGPGVEHRRDRGPGEGRPPARCGRVERGEQGRPEAELERARVVQEVLVVRREGGHGLEERRGGPGAPTPRRACRRRRPAGPCRATTRRLISGLASRGGARPPTPAGGASADGLRGKRRLSRGPCVASGSGVQWTGPPGGGASGGVGPARWRWPWPCGMAFEVARR